MTGGRSWLVVVTLGVALATSMAVAHPAEGESSPADGAVEWVEAISAAELEDLQALSEQLGLSLQATIDRYAWRDDFAEMVASIRAAEPDSLAGAEIVDSRRAWVAFSGTASDQAKEAIRSFGAGHPGVAVDIRENTGYSERDLERAVAAVHYAILIADQVVDAATWFDVDAQQITTVVTTVGSRNATVTELAAVADRELAALERLARVSVSVTRSPVPVLGGDDANDEHIGGENLNPGCTSGFVFRTASGLRGIATAGHCDNALTDDGVALAFQAQHEGNNGDFQWHTGPRPRPNSFYAGNADANEVNRRNVTAVGAPVVGQTLCKNGRTNKRQCQEVRKVNVCKGGLCNLIQMGARLAAAGDSGGPVYWGNTAYGLHQGWMWDIWPFDRDVFSRADRLPNALGVSVAVQP